MKCAHCAFENPPGLLFCGQCGTKLAFLCASCGFANPEGFIFCGKCGSPLRAESDAPVLQPAAKFASSQSYTPKYLAEKNSLL
jgi:hypothetical protein